MRCIDADKLQKDGWKLRREKQGLLTSTYETMELDCVPTVDAVEVVRCKDCKYFDKDENASESWCECVAHFGKYFAVDENDFCSYGERADE